jgi:hypothetical protein
VRPFAAAMPGGVVDLPHHAGPMGW